MKESKVLVINLSGAVTELIRHLVLSGINLEIVNDGKVVEAHHSDEDFLIDAQTDAGKYVIHLILTSLDKYCYCIETFRNESVCLSIRYNYYFFSGLVSL